MTKDGIRMVVDGPPDVDVPEDWTEQPDLITRMAEAAYELRNAGLGFPSLEPFSSQPPHFQAEVRAEMEMLRQMVLNDQRPKPQPPWQAFLYGERTD